MTWCSPRTVATYRGVRAGRPRGRRGHRAGRHRRHHLEYRQVASASRARRRRGGDPVLHHSQRAATRVQVDQSRRDRRHHHLGHRLCPFRPLRLPVLELQQDLRIPGRRHHLPALAKDHQPGITFRCRAETPRWNAVGNFRPGYPPRTTFSCHPATLGSSRRTRRRTLGISSRASNSGTAAGAARRRPVREQKTEG